MFQNFLQNSEIKQNNYKNIFKLAFKKIFYGIKKLVSRFNLKFTYFGLAAKKMKITICLIFALFALTCLFGSEAVPTESDEKDTLDNNEKDKPSIMGISEKDLVSMLILI